MNTNKKNSAADTSDKPARAVKGMALRLDDAALARVLDELDAASRQYAADKKRADQRYPYRHKALPVEMLLPDGENLSLRVPSRDLSRFGISFLHSGYVYVGTRCRIQLVTIHNNWQTAEGTVIRCLYIEGRVHDIGVKFDNPIDVATFASAALPRRILLADDDESFIKLARHHLEQINAEVTTASNGQEAVTKTDEQVFDVILMDVEMPTLDGIGAVKLLRQRGYRGSVVALTAHTGLGDRERLMEAGFDGYLGKPISKDTLADLINQFDEEPLFSTMANEAGMKELINQFVADLGKRIREIEEAAASNDLEALQRQARNLKGAAGSFGFEPITNAAKAVEDTAKAPSAAQQLKERIDELVTLCRIARPTST